MNPPDRVNLEKILDKFADLRAGVWGDVCVDRFITADAVRISREAAIPILEHRGESQAPGCGGNALHNVITLGAQASVAGLVGDDRAGRWFVDWCKKHQVEDSCLAANVAVCTPRKTRVMAGAPHAARHQVLRLDEGDLKNVSPVWWQKLDLAAWLKKLDVLILSDYGYGAVPADAWAAVRQHAPKVVLLDSRFSMADFSGVTGVTPNWGEAEAALGQTLDSKDYAQQVESLRNRLDLPLFLLTRGPDGMTLCSGDGVAEVPAWGEDAVDVTGAGDTVVATFALALGAGASPEHGMFLANMAGGIKVRKTGTVPVGLDELRQEVALV